MKTLITIFSLSLLALVLTACEPAVLEQTDLEQTQNGQKQTETETKQNDVIQPVDKETACIYKDGSCCQGEQGICQTVQVTCEEGKEPLIKGCDEKCGAVFECVANNLKTEKLTNAETKTQPSIIDCGIAKEITLSSSLKPIADLDTQKSWECFTNNLETCTFAKIQSTVSGTITQYQILGKEDDKCKVYGPKFTQTGLVNTTCRLSKDWVEFAFNTSEKQAPGEKYYKGISALTIITAGGNVQYPNKTFNVECNN